MKLRVTAAVTNKTHILVRTGGALQIVQPGMYVIVVPTAMVSAVHVGDTVTVEPE